MILFGILKIFMWLLLYYVETAGGLAEFGKKWKP